MSPGGEVVADHPYVILDADWVTDAERAGAEEFLRFLQAPEQRRPYQALGFRDRTGVPGAEDRVSGERTALGRAVVDPYRRAVAS